MVVSATCLSRYRAACGAAALVWGISLKLVSYIHHGPR